ncbi:MAG: UbiA-like polyprenyltransferase [Pirellulales bacterium]
MNTVTAGASELRTGSLVETGRRLLGLIRFSHTLFALPFALLGTAWAIAVPREQSGAMSAIELTKRTVLIVLCMIFARSAAMAFNRLVDAEIDGKNPRTASRHIPAGLLSKGTVLLFFAMTCIGFGLCCAAFWPNWIPLVGCVPVLAWICGYSLAKRFTAAAHIWLGIALALSPVCAWLALRGEEVIQTPTDILPAVVLAVAIACWVAGFDMIYACQDADFDRKSGLHSIPSALGIAGALRTAAVLHGLMLIDLAIMPVLFPGLGLGLLYWGTLAFVAILVVTQHRLVRPDDLGRVNLAFFHVNAIISLAFSTTAAIDAFI